MENEVGAFRALKLKNILNLIQKQTGGGATTGTVFWFLCIGQKTSCWVLDGLNAAIQKVSLNQYPEMYRRKAVKAGRTLSRS